MSLFARLAAFVIASTLSAVAAAAPITIDIPAGGSGSALVQNLTFGTTYGFTFAFENVTGSGQLQITANIVDGNACCGPSVSADIFNYSVNDLHTIIVQTPARPGYVGNLSFQINTYGSTRAGTVVIQDITVNGQTVAAAAAVPAPMSVALVAAGVFGLALATMFRRRQHAPIAA